ICGPWHNANTAPVYGNVDEGVGYVWSALTFEENSVVNGGNALSGSGGHASGFHSAFYDARGKNTAMTIRFWVGNTQGGFLEWSTNNGATWTPEFDSRVTAASP